MALEYPFITSVLPEAEGGGYLIEYPDLPGCMSDGETIQEAIENGRDAIRSWIETVRVHRDEIPAPGSSSGRWVQRVPKSLHTRLAQRAEHEGVSLNALVISLLAEGLGRKDVFPSEHEPQL
ncbi:toxin-antitoxin system HicB family antitoxin [Candidatus Poribacteria bacterium]|nr:MAG: toxin-antitoxin system HicB family antitoxin [Candidatus Poribacteria bacterium]